jgi:hypothetical protein
VTNVKPDGLRRAAPTFRSGWAQALRYVLKQTLEDGSQYERRGTPRLLLTPTPPNTAGDPKHRCRACRRIDSVGRG